MDSLDAQCLMFDLAERDEALPDEWAHTLEGGLVCRYGDSPRSFTWPPDAVADMASRWRASGRAVPRRIEQLVTGHEAFVAMLDGGELTPPDRVIHHIRTDELLAMWDEPKVCVVVGEEAPGDAVASG